MSHQINGPNENARISFNGDFRLNIRHITMWHCIDLHHLRRAISYVPHCRTATHHANATQYIWHRASLLIKDSIRDNRRVSLAQSHRRVIIEGEATVKPRKRSFALEIKGNKLGTKVDDPDAGSNSAPNVAFISFFLGDFFFNLPTTRLNQNVVKNNVDQLKSQI